MEVFFILLAFASFAAFVVSVIGFLLLWILKKQKLNWGLACLTCWCVMVVSGLIVGFSGEDVDPAKGKQTVESHQIISSRETKYDLTEETSSTETIQTETFPPAETTSRGSYLRDSVIEITCSTMSDPNVVGGVDFDIDVLNKSDATIKYVRFELLVMNRVGDPINSDIDFDSDPYFVLEMVGPIYPGDVGGIGEIWEAPFYNSTSSKWGINRMQIEYITGGTVELDKYDVRSVTQ